MKKKLAIGLAICILLGVLAGGAALYHYNTKPEALIDGLIPASQFAKRGHIHTDASPAENGDPFSLVYENKDGTKSMYVFSSPVRFQDEKGNWALIDNTLTEAEQPGYLYKNQTSDIHTYYPDMQTEKAFLLQYSKHKIKIDAITDSRAPAKKQDATLFDTAQEMVEYYRTKDMAVKYYTTNLGLKCQVTLNRPVEAQKLFFAIESELTVNAQNEKYFVMRDEQGKTAALVYQPVAADKDGAVLPSQTARLALQSSAGSRQEYMLEFAPSADKSSYPLTVELTYNFYKGNQVDSSIQSAIPNSNQYLDNYLYAGSQQPEGQAESYVRFETDSMDEFIKNNHIQSAQYDFYGLSGKPQPMGLFQCDTHWTSTKITWNTRQIFDTKLSGIAAGRPHCRTADVTALVKQWPENAVLKDNGFLLRGEQGTWEAFASADNGYMSPRLIITAGESQ